jgi:predicted nucleic acid-binding protein
VIVVSDTSPLNYLILVHAIDLLPRLFSDIYVPTEVMEELKRSRAPESVKTWVQSPPQWLRVATPSIAITTSIRLGPGEVKAIALAKELQAEAILIDERKGWRVANEHGLNAVGTLNVLEFAAERERSISGPLWNRCDKTTFYITDVYIDAALQRDASESDIDETVGLSGLLVF